MAQAEIFAHICGVMEWQPAHTKLCQLGLVSHNSCTIISNSPVLGSRLAAVSASVGSSDCCICFPSAQDLHATAASVG